MNKGIEYRDYKYIMQDISHMYLGAKYTFKELIEEEEIPFKIKSIVERYVIPELKELEIEVEDLSLESYFYYLKDKGFSFQTFKQLKSRIKFSILTEKKGLLGKPHREYTTKILELEDFADISLEEKKEKGVVIQEIIFSKLALMGFSI